MGLCFRCEYRAQFNEEGHAPRYECGNVKSSSCSCYMYKPVSPVILERNKGDKRTIGTGAFLSPRSHDVGKAEGHIAMRIINKKTNKHLLYWVP